MDTQANQPTPQAIAAAIVAEIRALPVETTPAVRAVRRRYSAALKQAIGPFVLDVAHVLLDRSGTRWVAYELIAAHPGAYGSLGAAQLEELGQGMAGWGDVDSFARILSGPAWRDGLLPGEVIHRWARSGDRWWRRAALVSTVALNVRSQGGSGDAVRTLEVCRLLVADRDDMVVKALSWALRELVVHDPRAVEGFLADHEDRLAGRVKREVRNKLASGLKNPRRR